MTVHPIERIAAILVGFEGVGIAALAAWQVLALMSGDFDFVATSIALIVLTLVSAAAVLGFAVAIWRGASWGRSGAIVTQLLILAVALGAVTGTYAEVSTGVLLGIPALVVLVLLIGAMRVAARRSSLVDDDSGSGLGV